MTDSETRQCFRSPVSSQRLTTSDSYQCRWCRLPLSSGLGLVLQETESGMLTGAQSVQKRLLFIQSMYVDSDR